MSQGRVKGPPTAFDPTAPLEPGITLIEASAGTGKTHAISSLYVRLIAERGLGVDSILVVTFTVAATAELRERLRVRIRQAVEALQAAMGTGPAAAHPDEVIRHLLDAPEEERRVRLLHLRLALETMDEAAISTIHGFCQRVLQQHALESGADFDAEVTEESRDLVAEVAGDLFLREMDRVPPWAAILIKNSPFLTSLLAAGQSLAEGIGGDLVPEPAEEAVLPDLSPLFAAWDAARREWAQSRDEAVARLLDAIAQKRLSRIYFKEENIRRARQTLEDWFSAGQESALYPPDELDLFREATFSKPRRCNSGKTPPTHPFYALVEAFLKRHEEFENGLTAYRLALFHRLLDEVRSEVARRKRRARVWSFHDLLVLVRDALRDPARGEGLKRALRRRFIVALVDEFQDTDHLQWEVFRTLFDAPEHSLYLIGDPKQAIYSFRGADVFAYLAAREHAHRSYTLLRNWRSDGRLVHALNTLYDRASRPFFLDQVACHPVDVPEEHRHDRLRFPDGPRAPLEIRFLGKTAFERMGLEPANKETARDHLYGVVARDIARLLAERPVLVEKDRRERPLGPRDIAVLVRKHEEAFAIQKTLRALGIPSVLHSEASVLASEAVDEMALVLAAVIAPDDRRAVRTALATRLVGRTLSEVVAREANEAEWEDDVSVFRRLQETWNQHGFLRMFRALLHERDAASRILAAPGGERLLTDLLHLAEILQVVESERGLGPEALLSWLVRERAVPTLDTDTRQLRLESDEDAVQVVTMHHAKGLEFGVVFCAFLWDGRLLNDRDYVLRFRDEESGEVRLYLKGSASDENRYKDHARREVFAENLRLAYVALTRARHRCVAYDVPIGKEYVTSALAWILHGPAEEDPASVCSRSGQLDESAMLEDLRCLERASDGTIAVTEVDLAETATPFRPTAPVPEAAIAAARFTRGGFDPTWRRASFSRWVRERDAEAPGEDERGRFLEPGRAGGGDALLRDFPGGRVAGRCLHAVFERFDPARDDLDAVVRGTLGEYGLEAGRFAGPVAEAVRFALETPLPSSVGVIRLRDVPAQDRLTEMEFMYPVAGGMDARGDPVSGGTLARVLESAGTGVTRRYAQALRALQVPEVRGFMTGQADLVFRVGRTWHLLDYKSNDLGPTRADYAPPRLEDEMVASHYVLQYLLYAVALYRYLVWRVPDFDWDRDMGGVFYLFLRGLDGTGRTGVFHDRPDGALIRALSEAFGPGSPG